MARYTNQGVTKVVYVDWKEDGTPFTTQVKEAFGGDLYDYGEDWLSIINDQGEEELYLNVEVDE